MSLVLNVEILGEFKKLTQATTGAQNSLKKLEKGVGGISRTIGTTLAAIGVGFSLNAVVSGIKGAIDAASDLEQQFGALESIFKDTAPVMKAFAREQQTIGLSSADAARSMALLGSQLKGYGLPVEEAASKTQELTKLAADLAATFGGTTYGAVESISALFRGEYDPIEKYGVAIKKSDVNARLAAEGLSGLEGQELKLAEAQAALTLLFEKTTDAQGQAAREADTYASKSAALQAQFTNLQAEMGEKLLPVMIQVMEAIMDNWDSIEALILKIGDFIPVIVNGLIPVIDWLTNENGFGGLDAKIGLVGVSLFSLMNNRLILFAASNPTMAAALAGIALIAAGMMTVYESTKQATTALQEYQRLQSIQAVTSNPVATAEQIAGATYKGILEAPKKATAPIKASIPIPAKEKVGGVITNNVTVEVKQISDAPKIISSLQNYTIANGSNITRLLK